MNDAYPVWLEHFDAAVRGDELICRLLAGKWHFYLGQDAICLPGDERMTLCLAMGAARNRKTLVIEMPAPQSRIGRLVAIGLLLADWADRRSGPSRRLQGDILFITQHVGKARAELKQVQVGESLLSSVSLADVWDVLRVRSRDFRFPGQNPRLYLANPGNRDEIGALRRVRAVIIDASHPRTLGPIMELLELETVSRANTHILVVPAGHECLDSLVMKVGEPNIVCWVWNPGAIECACRCYRLPPLANSGVPRRSERRLLLCIDTELDDVLVSMRTRLAGAHQHIRGRTPHEIITAWWLYNRLSHLTVPLMEYEEQARRHMLAIPLRHRLETLQVLRLVDDYSGDLGNYLAVQWPALVEDLVKAYNILLQRREPTKFWGVAETIQSYVESGIDNSPGLRVVCPTQIEARLLADLLIQIVDGAEDLLHSGSIAFVSAKEEARLASVPGTPMSTILCGPRRSRWRYLDTFVPGTTSVLAYPHEAVVDQANLKRLYGRLRERVTSTARLQALAALGLASQVLEVTDCLDDVDRLTLPTFRQETVYEETGPPPGLPQERHLIEFVPTLEDWTDSWPEELGPLVSITGRPTRVEVDIGDTGVEGPCVAVAYETGETLVYPSDWLLDVFRPVNDLLVRRRADELEEGDLVLVFEDDIFASLYERMMETLETQQIRSKMLLELWELTKRQALERFDGDLDALYEFLHRNGLSVQRQTVANWVQGRTLAPQRDKDLHLVARASKNQLALANVKRIRYVIGKVRGLRRLVGRKLGEMLRQAAVSDDLETDAEELGLGADDILTAVSIKRVESVGQRA